MKHITLITLFFSSFTVSGCATNLNSQSGPGFFYSDYYEGALVTNIPAGRKRGQACTENIMGLVATGDASVSSAMKNGAITVVSSVDHYHKSVIGVWGKNCVIVTGN
jgi:hypothetical protein